MIKIISSVGWNFGEALNTTIKKTASGRLVGQDLQDLVKRAGVEFANSIKSTDILPGEHPIHTIAMGATETYGPNRNGDGFKAAMLRKYHPTFVKSARRYRHHQHNDPAKSYGRVIKSAFNEPMQRVELLIGLNATKEAADRNGGLVADLEMEKIARGEDIADSMAIHVPYDVCASCNHQARTRSNYCTEETCVSPDGVKRGGCRHNLAKVAHDGFMNHVDNTRGEFFDISMVTVGADPIAHGNTADYLKKVASGEYFYGGAELAEALNIVEPLSFRLRNIFNQKVAQQIKAAYLLAAEEATLNEGDPRDLRAVRYGTPQITADHLGPVRSPMFKQALAGLARQNICLSPVEFLGVLSSELPPVEFDKLAGDFYAALPGVFTRLTSLSSLENLVIDHDMAVPAETHAFVDSGLGDLYTERSFAKEAADRRVVRSIVRGEIEQKIRQTKTASSLSSRADAAAKLYALYKVAHLAAQPEQEQKRTARLLVCQNVL